MEASGIEPVKDPRRTQPRHSGVLLERRAHGQGSAASPVADRELTSRRGGYEVLVDGERVEHAADAGDASLVAHCDRVPMSAETLGVTMQVRSPTVIAFALTAVTVPVC